MTVTEPHRSKRYLEAPPAELAARRAATRLRNWLRVNAVLSCTTGTIGLLFAGPLANLFEVEESWAIRLLGAALIPFALGVFTIAGAKTATLATWSAEVSLADFGWVLGTALVVGLGWLSATGIVVMGTIAAVVLGLGIGQLRSRRSLLNAVGETTAALDEYPPIETHEYWRSTSGQPAQLWPVITDHGLYAELALNLERAENRTPNGPGFERSCTDTAGRTWSETCTLWEPERRFDVDVDIDSYPYPLQLVQGSWRVEPVSEATSTVGMIFAFQPTPGFSGRLFTPMMHLLFPPVLKRIAKGWERAARPSAAAASGTGRTPSNG